MKVVAKINIINAINIIYNIKSCYLILSNSTSFRIRKTLDILVNPQDHLKDVVFGISCCATICSATRSNNLKHKLY